MTDPMNQSGDKSTGLLLSEAKWRTERIAERADSVATRAGLLVGFAALAATMPKELHSIWAQWATVFSLAAALFGIAATIFPSALFNARLEDLQTKINEDGAAKAEAWLATTKVELHKKARNSLRRRFYTMTLGYLCLAGSIGFALRDMFP